MTTSSAEKTAWGSRHWRRPTPVVTRSISSSNKRRARISPISKLGDDLLVEILIRSFPDPKSACRCKAVCKQWSSLISSPSFNRRFVSHYLKFVVQIRITVGKTKHQVGIASSGVISSSSSKL
ncbi:hypothetical protein LINGRAHAP2_LOCUS25926 [Linum grandiflorum]